MNIKCVCVGVCGKKSCDDVCVYVLLAVLLLLCKSVVCEFKYLNDGDGVVMNDESTHK